MTSEEYLAGVTSAICGVDLAAIDAAVQILHRAYADRRAVFTCGNGGSASTASHLVCDLQKSVVGPDGRGLRAIALTDSLPLITAWSNDFDYSRVFAEQVSALASEGDVLLAISASGNSPNVILAVERANSMGLTTIGLAGYQGGKLRQVAQRCIVVPSDNMQMIEDAHLVVGHLIFSRLRDDLASSS